MRPGTYSGQGPHLLMQVVQHAQGVIDVRRAALGHRVHQAPQRPVVRRRARRAAVRRQQLRDADQRPPARLTASPQTCHLARALGARGSGGSSQYGW